MRAKITNMTNIIKIAAVGTICYVPVTTLLVDKIFSIALAKIGKLDMYYHCTVTTLNIISGVI